MKDNKELMQELEAFIASKKGVPMEEAKADPKGQELKEKFLKVLDEMEAGEGGETIRAMRSQIDAQSDEIRAEIGKLVYEGRATEDNIRAILEQKGISGPDTVSAGKCISCVQCASCVMCALCFASASAVASSLSVVSNVAAIGS